MRSITVVELHGVLGRVVACGNGYDGGGVVDGWMESYVEANKGTII